MPKGQIAPATEETTDSAGRMAVIDVQILYSTVVFIAHALRMPTYSTTPVLLAQQLLVLRPRKSITAELPPPFGSPVCRWIFLSPLRHTLP